MFRIALILTIIFPVTAAYADGKIAIDLRHRINAAARVVTLEDAADLSAMPSRLRASVARRPLFDLPEDMRGDVVMPADALITRIRGRIPGALLWDIGARDQTVVLNFPVQDVRRAPGTLSRYSCLHVVRDVTKGDVLKHADVAPSDCLRTRGKQRAVFYDPQSRVARARHDLAAGEDIGGVPGFAFAGTSMGETVTITARVGSVTVENRVMVIQPGRPGKPVFVKDGNGKVFALTAPTAGNGP